MHKEGIITKFTVASLIYDQETPSFKYNFPITSVFDTPEETLQAIECSLQQQPNTWHTICPLYLPSELEEETDISQCLHLDSVVKGEMLKEQQQEEEEKGAFIVPMEEVYHENGKIFPDDTFSAKK